MEFWASCTLHTAFTKERLTLTLMIRRISEKHDKVFVNGCLEPQINGDRANAAFVVLARDKELEGVIQSLKSIERHFNRWFHYPYVFLNDGEFSTEFKETITNYTSAPVEFGKIDPSMWGYPDWVNADVAREGIRKQGDAAIMYGGMESYHHMCRFYSGYVVAASTNSAIANQSTGSSTSMNYCKNMSGIGALNQRSSTSATSPSNVHPISLAQALALMRSSDPFQHMIRANKTYGFTIAVKELKETVPNIFRYASAYKRNHNLKSQGLWEMFIEPKPKEPEPLPKSDPKHQDPLPEEILNTEPGHRRLPDIDPEAMEGETYNMCHFWSNFEIARLDFFRSKEYEEFFETMDRSGGFWMERVCRNANIWACPPANVLIVG